MPPLANIGRGQRQLRLYSAIAIVALTLLYAVLVVVLKLDPLLRLLVFFPLVSAAGGYLEARTSTCVTLALSNQCSMEENFSIRRVVQGDTVQDPALAAALRRRAMGLVARMFVFALIGTAVFYFLPV